LRWSKRKQSLGARSGEYGGCGAVLSSWTAINCWTRFETCELVWKSMGSDNRRVSFIIRHRLWGMTEASPNSLCLENWIWTCWLVHGRLWMPVAFTLNSCWL
jgi:hypothetical protein